MITATPPPTARFQSTPSHWTGRICEDDVIDRVECCFNPRPVIGLGESESFLFFRHSKGVSIHAQSLDWANRENVVLKNSVRMVSIHAQSLDWANPATSGCNRQTGCFNPRPVIGLGESCEEWHNFQNFAEFQSTPSHWTGRIRIWLITP